MDSNILAPLNRKILGLLCLALFAQSLLAAPDVNYHGHRATSKNRQHSRVARTVRPRSQNMRQTKFSHLGPAGIRAYDSHTAKINGVFIGLIPDAGDTGGNVQTMHEIIQSINGKRPAVFGWYAQVSVHSKFDGSQLFEVMDDLKKSNAVFSPAIMPKVVGQVLDVEITIKLSPLPSQLVSTHPRIPWWARRFQGSMGCPRRCSPGARSRCPSSLVSECIHMEEYRKYAPDNMDDTVDLVGFDYYPKSKPQAGEFLKKAKEFHDTFAINGRKFAMGEAGLHYQGTIEERVDWLLQMANSRKELPNLLYINWYNSKKEFDYKIAGNGVSTKLLTEKLE
ncbi:hypothetical protein H4Q26_014983 [Puccinia striiformis f. sp. tritici PST-130]|nr:hypothetical protein H4Q26_014983 [Puccinia striiformis f. sp. tritici PST-130]